MKLLTKLFSVLSIFFISIYLVSSNISYDQKKWETFSEKAEYKKIYVQFFEKSDEEIYDILTKSAKKYKINIIKTNIYNPWDDDNSEISSYVFLGSSDIKLIDNKDFVSGSFFSYEQTEDDVYVSSRDDSMSCGKIYSFLNWNNVEIGTLKRLLKNKKSLKGEYVVRYSYENDCNNFLEDLTKEFKTDKKNLIEKTYGFNTSDQSNIEDVSKIFLIACMVLLAITSVFFSAKNLKNAGIMKICGYSIKDIFIEVLGSVFAYSSIFSIAFNIFLTVFYKNVSLEFLMQLILHQFFIHILIFLGIIPSLFLFKNYKISDLINDRNPLKIVNTISFAVKSAIVFVLIFQSFCLPKKISDIPKLIKEYESLEKISDFALLDYKGQNEQAFMGAQTEVPNCKKIFTNLDKKDSIYCFFNNIEIDPKLTSKYLNDDKYKNIIDDQLLNIYANLKTLTVNPNYFKKFEIKNTNNENVNFDNYKNQRIILRPSSSDFSEEIIKKIYEFNLMKIINSEEKIYENSNYNSSIKVLTYDDSKNKFCTFNDKLQQNIANENEINLFEKSLFFEVVTPELMTMREFSFITFRGMKSALKLDIRGKNFSDFSKEFEKMLEEMEINKNDYTFYTIKDVYNKELNLINKSIASILYETSLVFILLILTLFQIIKIYIETYKKSIYVKKINGFGLKQCHKNYLIALFSCNVFSIFLVCYYFCLNSIKANMANARIKIPYYTNEIILAGILFIFLDILISCFIIRFNEKRKLADIIKGA